jgi:hypothetical protein
MYYYNFSSNSTPKNKKLTDLENQYSTEFDKFENNKKAFFKECAKAYMEKKYRGIPTTSNSDLFLMASVVINRESYQVDRIMNFMTSELIAMDNQMTVGIALMLIHAMKDENFTYTVSPQVLRQKCDGVEAPSWINLPDILSLRKIKAQSKLLDSIEKMKQIAADYNGVLDGTDD